MKYLQGLREMLGGIRITGEISAAQILTMVLAVGLAIISVQLTGLYSNSTALSVAMRESSFEKGRITGRLEAMERFDETTFETGRIQGRQEAMERFDEMATDCIERSARIEGYLDALLFSTELESEEQLKRIADDLRRLTSDN